MNAALRAAGDPTLAASIVPDGWRAGDWAIPVVVLTVVLAVALAMSWRRGVRGWAGPAAIAMKAAALVALLLLLLEPISRTESLEPQANLFAVLVDDSRSVRVDESERTAAAVRDALADDAAWRERLATDFDLRLFAYDRRLRPLDSLADLRGEGTASDLATALDELSERIGERPLAGVLLMTDGNDTAASGPDLLDRVPDGVPVFPVPIGPAASGDLSLRSIVARQTNFEAAPVTVTARVAANGIADGEATVRVVDEGGKVLQSQQIAIEGGEQSVTFRLQPREPGVRFFRVEVVSEIDEATTQNNAGTLVVDRSGGPYRVLYVCGRPNWEFKFLRRALDEDDQLDLVGLVRIAKREPKFTFRDSADDSNPLFRGTDADAEEAEAYDEPVLLRLGTRDADELRGGFPKTEDDLFGYHAIVIDDLEAGFFAQDQQRLVQEFVRRRGGGLLMLGGLDTFAAGGYARTPIGELLPVYCDRERLPERRGPDRYRLALTRDGWLQPWTRLRPTQSEETARLRSLPAQRVVSRVDAIKPAARVLAEVADAESDAVYPALVSQPFGRGQVGASLIGDLWRQQMTRRRPADDDFGKAWRQTIRWLVGEVPHRVEVGVLDSGDDREIRVVVRDESWGRLDNAEVTLSVTRPDGTTLQLPAGADPESSGEYVARLQPRQTGGYRIEAQATAPDGSEVGSAVAGAVFDPMATELARVGIDREWLEQIAETTGGRVVEPSRLGSLIGEMRSREVPVMRTTVHPFWHNWPMLLAVIGLLAGEWGLRRWKGLP